LEFVKVDTKEASPNIKILEIVQATFYTMIVNLALEREILPCIMAKTLRSAFVNLG